MPGALLRAIRSHVSGPSHEIINLVVEGDERLCALVVSVGAIVRHQVLHLEGRL